MAISRSEMFPFPKVGPSGRASKEDDAKFVEQINYYIDEYEEFEPSDEVIQIDEIDVRSSIGLASTDPNSIDPISSKSQLVREAFRLSAREAEVMELIARGNSVARIAEMLVVSENTIRTHSKRIYAKLDIHKRQELIDLINSF